MERTMTKLPSALPEMPTLKRVAAYTRVSSSKDAMLHSLSAQVSYYSELIQNTPGWTYAGVYCEEGRSGTLDKRPEFQRLMADCRAGKIDLILVKSISRLARNTLTFLETVRELKSLAVDIYFENERISAMSAMGELMMTLVAGFMQEESRAVSENCKWRIRQQYAKGNPVSLCLYGYKLTPDGLQIVEDEAEVVRHIYGLALGGMGKRAIARALTAMGVEPPFSEVWQESTVMYILQSEKYIGEMRLQKTFVTDNLTKHKLRNKGERPDYYVTESHEPIIDRDVYDRVQQLIAERRQKYNPTPAPPVRSTLTGLVECGLCGAHFQRKIANSGSKYASAVWVCATKKQGGKHACSAKQIPECVLLDLVDTQGPKRILVTGPNALTLELCDGQRIDHEWADHSRKDSWDEAARQRAREGYRR